MWNVRDNKDKLGMTREHSQFLDNDSAFKMINAFLLWHAKGNVNLSMNRKYAVNRD